MYARELGLTYEPSDKELYGMSDSDWATRHSTTGTRLYVRAPRYSAAAASPPAGGAAGGVGAPATA